MLLSLPTYTPQKKLPELFDHVGPRTHLLDGSLGPQEFLVSCAHTSQLPKRYLGGSTIFAQLTRAPNTQTDTSVAIGRISRTACR